MPRFDKKQRTISPARLLALSFFTIITVAALLLFLPISSKSGEFTDLTDCFFTTTSATCVSGIAVFDTYTHWSIFGQCVIMLCMQLGGLGFLTLVTFFNLALGRKMGLKRTSDMVSDFSVLGMDSAKSLFTRIIAYSLVFETAGALVLMIDFVPKHGGYGVFMAFFMAVSAFCNAGFDVMGIESAGEGLLHYAGNPLVLVTIMLLIIIGGLGFLVWINLLTYHKTKSILLHTKIVLLMTGVLLVVGAVFYMIIAASDKTTFGGLSAGETILTSFFASASSRTCGLTTLPYPTATEFAKLFTMILMFIGAAPASTGGGLKVTTFAIMIATALSVVRNREDTELLGHRVKKQVVYKTLTILGLSLLFMGLAFLVIYVTNENLSAVDILFETVSAFSTTGYTSGVSAQCGIAAKIVLMLCMFIGRVGPVSIVLSITMNKAPDRNTVIPESNILVG